MLQYSTFHALLLVALCFFGKLRSKAKKKKKLQFGTCNVYRKKVRERELGVNLYGV